MRSGLSAWHSRAQSTMKAAVLLVLIAAAAQAVPRAGAPRATLRQLREAAADRGAAARVVGGHEVQRGDLPYQVGLYVNGRFRCGGSLIAQRWVVTAAHCVDPGNQFRVVLGVANLDDKDSDRVDVDTDLVIVHEEWDGWTISNDITLLRLSKPVTYSKYIQPIALAKAGCDSSLDGQFAHPSGWGKISDSTNTITNILRTVDVNIIPNSQCADYYGWIIDQTKVCSRPRKGTVGGVCNGDSGGPLVLDSTGEQIGINSFVSSEGCEAPSPPHAYTRVPCFYDWVQDTIARNS